MSDWGIGRIDFNVCERPGPEGYVMGTLGLHEARGPFQGSRVGQKSRTTSYMGAMYGLRVSRILPSPASAGRVGCEIMFSEIVE